MSRNKTSVYIQHNCNKTPKAGLEKTQVSIVFFKKPGFIVFFRMTRIFFGENNLNFLYGNSKIIIM